MTQSKSKTEAAFYLDLLQVCGGILHADDSWFHEREVFRYGGTAVPLGYHTVVGIEQAAYLLAEVDTGDDALPSELLKHLAVNPLVRHLGVDLQRIAGELPLGTQMDAVEEGRRLPSEFHYLRFEATSVLMAIAALAMDRIIAWQSHITNDTLESLEQLRESAGGELPVLVNMGSMRQYTATLAAYFARARSLAGIERFVDERFRVRSWQFDHAGHRDWQLKSHELVARVTDEAHRASMARRYGSSIAERLIRDGLYWLHDGDYLNYGLQGFVLDGEVANSFRNNGAYAYSVSGGTTAAETDDFMIDSAYQAMWTPPPIDIAGVYGAHGRNLASPLATYADRPVTRGKWTRIPKILIHDFRELDEIVARVREAFPSRRIFFRGQGRHYSIGRSPETLEFLYGTPTMDELSLPTAASRHKFEFDGFIAAFQLQVQGMLYTRFDRDRFAGPRADFVSWGPLSPFADAEVGAMYEKWFRLFYSYEWELLVMGLAQHYGIPTHGLDVTDDLSIALWFALHRWFEWEADRGKVCWYAPSQRAAVPVLEHYPVVYILATDDDVKRDLDQVEYAEIPALRPSRQHAYLHYGGWGFHTNICAEDVVAAVFLSERFDAGDLPSVTWLFPSEQEDAFYGQMLELKRCALATGMEWGYASIAEYRPPNTPRRGK
ncbi:MAG TPA: FRG domain-containing protein [Thermoanaerobaculia bacterium]